MENKVLKVRIKKSSGERYWYADQIGEVFEVVDIGHKSDYTVSEDYLLGENAGWRHIQKDDCEIIPASLSQPSKDVESAAKEWAGRLANVHRKDSVGSISCWMTDFEAGAKWMQSATASHQPQCQMKWVRLADVFNDLPLNTGFAVKDKWRKGLGTMQTFGAGNKQLYYYTDKGMFSAIWPFTDIEILSESLSSSPAEDKVQILVGLVQELGKLMPAHINPYNLGEEGRISIIISKLNRLVQ